MQPGDSGQCRADAAEQLTPIEGASDAFGKRGLEELEKKLELLPPHSRFCVQRLLGILEKLQDEITHFEARMRKVFRTRRPLELLQTCLEWDLYCRWSFFLRRERSVGFLTHHA
jgi:hypothetical protein